MARRSKYVSLTGSNLNDGSQGAPWLTVLYALGQALLWDDLFLFEGIWNARIFEVDFARTGTDWVNDWLSVQGMPGQSVIIRGGSGGNMARFQDGSIHHVLLKHLTLDGQQFDPYLLYCADTSHHLHFESVELKNSALEGGLVGGTSHEFRDMNCHDNGTQVGRSAHGIYGFCDNSLFSGGRYWNNQCVGLRLGDSTPTHFASNNVVENAEFYGNGTAGPAACPSIGVGLLFGGQNNLARNCVGWNNGSANFAVYPLTGRPATAEKFHNCTSVDGVAYGFHLYDVGGPAIATSCEIKNCIDYNSGSADLFDEGTGSVLVTNWETSDGDPDFVNAGARNYRLNDTSNLIDAGTTLGSVVSDFDGVPRPQGSVYDIGAFENTSGGGGTGTTGTFARGGSTTSGSLVSGTTISTAAAVHAAGDVLIASIYVATADAVVGVSDTANGVWADGGVDIQAGGAYYLKKWYCLSSPGHPNNVVSVLFATSVTCGVTVENYPATGEVTFDVGATQSALSASSISQSITAANDNELIHASVSRSTVGGAFTAGSGFTARTLQYYDYQTEDRLDASAGSVTVEMFSGPTGVDLVMAILAFTTTGGGSPAITLAGLMNRPQLLGGVL